MSAKAACWRSVSWSSAHAEMIHGRIVGVVDRGYRGVAGSCSETVPRPAAGRRPGKQPFGQRSKQNLSIWSLRPAGRRGVTTNRTKYKRSVCKIVVDSKDANLAQVEVVTICDDHLAGR